MNKDPLTYQIIGEAMATHSEIGPGLDEEIYHQDLCGRLRSAGIECRSKPRSDFFYKDIVVDVFEPDLLIAQKLVIELKSVYGGFSGEHFTQILCYLKFLRIRTGLLLNFGRESLEKKRVLYDSHTGSFAATEIPDFVNDINLVETLLRSANSCITDVGLGYRDTTWFKILLVELGNSDLSCTPNPTGKVKGKTNHIFPCIVVENKCVVTIGALGEGVSPADRARLQTYLKWLELPWGAVLHFGKTSCDLKFVTRPSKN